MRIEAQDLAVDLPKCTALGHVECAVAGEGKMVGDVEAMAAGLPVVATNVGGIPEVLAGTDSVMVLPDDPEALREGVLGTLNRTPEEKERAIMKGRERAEDFRIRNRVDAMVTLYKDVLHG